MVLLPLATPIAHPPYLSTTNKESATRPNPRGLYNGAVNPARTSGTSSQHTFKLKEVDGTEAAETELNRFQSLASKLVTVPKKEIDRRAKAHERKKKRTA